MRTPRTINSSGAGLEDSDLYPGDHHWGDKQIALDAPNLPALKARYLLDNLPRSGRVLEIGCGGGRLLNTVAALRPRLELHGCDIRPLHYTPTRFQFQCVALDDATLPYQPETFDAVVMFDVLEHFVDPSAALHAARVVLQPYGHLVSFTPLEGQMLSFYRLFRYLLGDDLYVRTKEHIQAFSETALRRLLVQEFAVVDYAYAYHLLGHLMDASFFALLASARMRRRFWEENPYYEEEAGGGRAGNGHSLLGAVLRAGNAVAYAESMALKRVRYGAAGLLFVAAPR
ncbi:MAG: class I SAM-dependent methyltransferase [Candidatus Dormibacteria bacterium]